MVPRSPGRVRAVLAAAIVGALALLGPGAASAASVGIGLECYKNPELTRVTNNTSSRIRVRTISSTYRPQDFEPIPVGVYVAPGKTRTFQSGFKASTNVLTRNFIYSNLGELDGTRVVTSVGTFTRKC